MERGELTPAEVAGDDVPRKAIGGGAAVMEIACSAAICASSCAGVGAALIFPAACVSSKAFSICESVYAWMFEALLSSGHIRT